MNEEEAHAIAAAYAEAAVHYPILNLDPKIAATLNLCSTLAIVYGAKFTAFKMRKAMSRPNVVTPMRPVPMKTAGNGLSTSPPPNEFPQPPQGEQQINGVDLKAHDVPPVETRMRTGEIPGVGAVVFPEDHPLGGGKKQTH